MRECRGAWNAPEKGRFHLSLNQSDIEVNVAALLCGEQIIIVRSAGAAVKPPDGVTFMSFWR